MSGEMSGEISDAMTDMTPDTAVLSSTALPYQGKTPRQRNLGSAILLAAIQDYRSLDEQAHGHAAEFLYPRTVEWQNHYDWAVALAEGIDPAWLRDALDRFRSKWDRRRGERMTWRRRQTMQTTILRRRKANEPRQPTP